MRSRPKDRDNLFIITFLLIVFSIGRKVNENRGKLVYAADVVVNFPDETFLTSGASAKLYRIIRKNIGIIWLWPNLKE